MNEWNFTYKGSPRTANDRHASPSDPNFDSLVWTKGKASIHLKNLRNEAQNAALPGNKVPKQDSNCSHWVLRDRKGRERKTIRYGVIITGMGKVKRIHGPCWKELVRIARGVIEGKVSYEKVMEEQLDDQIMFVVERREEKGGTISEIEGDLLATNRLQPDPKQLRHRINWLWDHGFLYRARKGTKYRWFVTDAKAA